MTAKSITHECFVLDEADDGAHLLSVTADFISTDCVYLGIRGRSYAVDTEQAREIAPLHTRRDRRNPVHMTLTVALDGSIPPDRLRDELDQVMGRFDECLEVALHRDESPYAETFEAQLAKAKASDRDNWTEGLTDAEIVERWNGDTNFYADGWPLTTSNPLGYWDWFVVGGRWGGSWVLKEGATNGPIATENHALGRSPEADADRRTDNARLRDLEAESLVPTYAYVDLDGGWTHRWVGPTREEAVSGTFPKDTSHWEVGAEGFAASFLKFIQDLPADTWLVQIDYHH